MSYCSNCGTEMQGGFASCQQCGHPVIVGSPVIAAGTRDPVTGRVLSGWWRRVGAGLIDGLIVAIPGIIVQAVFSIGIFGRRHFAVDPANPLPRAALRGIFAASIVGLVITLLYRVLMDGSPRGQTLGKMALGIALRDAETGTVSIGYSRAFTRYLVSSIFGLIAVVPLLFFVPLIDVLFPLWDSRNQTLHDKVARSIVVKA